MYSANFVYQDEEQSYHGFLAYDDSIDTPRPAVLIAHDWTGRNEFACLKAEKLASMGYVGFAIDMYGEAKQGKNNDEKAALMTPLLEDRNSLRKRMQNAYQALCEIPQACPNNIAVIGYCFGGLCALDLARSGADLKATVSFHGLLNAPQDTSTDTIKSKILVLHGYNDPMVPIEQVEAFAQEMTNKNADWQLHMYGNTLHAFTNPLANDKDFGTLYDQKADQRSWQSMCAFFEENLNN